MLLARISQYDLRYPVGAELGSASISANAFARLRSVWVAFGGSAGMSLRSDDVTILRSSGGLFWVNNCLSLSCNCPVAAFRLRFCQ